MSRTTTELNRLVAAKRGWNERRAPDGYLWEHPQYDFAAGYIAFCDGVAWADSADVALAELLPKLPRDLVIQSARMVDDEAVLWIVGELNSSGYLCPSCDTLARAICEAYLEVGDE